MAFKSFDELINMASEDPKMARMRVARAKKKKIPIVSSDNPGYGRSYKVYKYKKSPSTGLSKSKSTSRYGAISRRIAAMQGSKSVSPKVPPRTPTPENPSDKFDSKKKINPAAMASRRKQVGY